MGDTIRLRIKRYDGSGFDYKEVETAEEATYWKRNYGAVEAPEQNVGEFASKATQSFHPSTIKEGVQRMVTDPIGMARDLGQLPIDLASEGVGEFRQGNLLRGGRKLFEAALPVAGGVAGMVAGMPGGPPGMAAGGLGGYMGGAGVASGMDAATGYAEQDLPASAAGAAVDAGIQGALGVRAGRPRPAPMSAAEQATALEQKVGKVSARTFGPTVGPNRYALGNEARRLGSPMLRQTTGWSVDTMVNQLENLRGRATANLDAAYDLIPSGVRMKTADVMAGLRRELGKVQTRDRNNNPVVPAGKREYATALQHAIDELDSLPPTLDAPTIRNLRQGWDNLAQDVWEPKTNADWKRIRAEGKAFADARTVLNEQTKKTYPHLGPQMAETTFALQATDLLRALEESENARSRIGRRAISGVGGLTAGVVTGGPLGGAIGAITAPAVEYLVTEKLGPGGKIAAARAMANMAAELRANGQTPAAMRYAQELKRLTQPVGPTIRAAEAMQNRPAGQPAPAPAASAAIVAPEQAAAAGLSPGGWFDSVMKRGQ